MATRGGRQGTDGSHLVNALSNSQSTDGENSHEKKCSRPFGLSMTAQGGGDDELTHVEFRAGSFEVNWSRVSLHRLLSRNNVVRSCVHHDSIYRHAYVTQRREKRTVNEGIHFNEIWQRPSCISTLPLHHAAHGLAPRSTPHALQHSPHSPPRSNSAPLSVARDHSQRRRTTRHQIHAITAPSTHARTVGSTEGR